MPNYTNPLFEPADHALGRSRGGLSTKVHHACDGRGRPLAVLVGPGQAHDGPMLPFVLGAIIVPRLGPGRARTRPDAVLGDKAYSSRATRRLLHSRGITAVIPEPRDQQAHRKRHAADCSEEVDTTARASHLERDIRRAPAQEASPAVSAEKLLAH